MPQSQPMDSDLSQSPPVWSTNRRRVVSALVAFHLAAVFIAPWSSPPPAPVIAQELAAGLAPYHAAAFLNHGYRFFAPNPGPSHVVRYEVARDDGSTIEGRIPDPSWHWPRLLYHRHFMMTETLFTNWSRVETIPTDVELPAQDRQAIENRNAYLMQLNEWIAQGMARQLLTRHSGESIKLQLQEHSIPYPDDILGGRRLDAPDLYVNITDLGSFPKHDEPRP